MIRLSDAAVVRLREAVASVDDDLGSSRSGARYELGEEIGRGGMAVVYRAYDRVVGREVALKTTSGEPSSDQGWRLIEEARTSATLEHPGLVPIYDAGVLPDGRPYCAMRLVHGMRFDEYLAASRSLAERLILFLRICEPIGFAHSRGIVHRDLKPSNIIVGPFGDVLVLDWGIAAATNSRSEARTVVGTPGYMAPEQGTAGSERVDARADVYALGVLLHDCLEGVAPSDRRRRAVEAIARRAASHEPRDRYPDCASLIADVTAVLNGSAVSAYHERLGERTLRLLAKHRAAVAVIGMYLLVRILLLVGASG